MNGASAAPMIAAIVMRARRRIIAHLEEAGATAEDKAIAFAPQRQLERKALEFLLRKGLVVETRPGRYFVHADKAAEWHEGLHRRARIGIVTAVAAVAAAAAAAAMFASHG